VKLLKSSVAPGSQLGQRFDREAALLASMTHQNIPQVHDAGVTPEGRPFLVMELVDGLSLAALVKRAQGERSPATCRRRSPSRSPARWSTSTLRGVCTATCKPANVLVAAAAR
jgi:serine/threonine protein kinase